MGSHWIYTGSFIGALAISLILVPLVRRIAISRTIMDAPGGHKSHSLPVPYLGGLAMVVAFSVAVIAGALVRQDLSFVDGAISFNPGGIFEPGASTLGELLLVLALALALSVMGLVDDLRGLHPYVRLAVELGVAVALIAYGIQLKSPLPDSIDTIITVIWIIGITNAMNLLDNVDGLAAGVTGVAGATFLCLLTPIINRLQRYLQLVLLDARLVSCAATSIQQRSIWVMPAVCILVSFFHISVSKSR